MHGSIYGYLGVDSPFDPSFSLVTSPILSPAALAGLRLFIAFYATVFVLVRLIYEGIRYHSDGTFFSYFTSLSYIGLLSYFWASGVQTLFYALSVRSGSKPPSYPLQSWPRPLQFLHLLLFSTIVTFPIIVTAVFWSLLSSPDTLATRYSAWANISEHALNTALAGLEILITNVSPSLPRRSSTGIGLPWAHLPFLVGLLACYLGVAYITNGTQHFYTYSFLDPHTEHGKLAAYIVGIAVAEIVIFVVVRYIMMLRQYFVLRATQLEGRAAYQYEGEDISEVKVAAEIGKGQSDDWDEVSRPAGTTTREVAELAV